VHEIEPPEVVDVVLTGIDDVVVDVVDDVVEDEVEVVVDEVVLDDVLVVVPPRRPGRARALTAVGAGSRTCTASQRARRPVTAPHASCVRAGVWIGPGGATCGAAPPAVAQRTTVPTASVTATVTTHNFRDRDFDILDHPAPPATSPGLSTPTAGN